MRILIITDFPPFPVSAGAALRIYSLLRRVAAKHEVWLASLKATPGHAAGLEHLREICEVVETADIRQARALTRPVEGLRYLLAGRPPDLRFRWSEELAFKIRRLAARVAFDVVQVELGQMGPYLEVLPPALQKKSIWMLHDIDWSKYERIRHLETSGPRKLRSWLHGYMMRRWQPDFAERFGRCTTVSENDKRLLMEANPRLHVDVISNGVDTRVCQPLPRETSAPSLLFVGNMDYLPCADAVVWFCHEVLPLIRRVIPGVEMWIVGANPRSEVRRLDGNGIKVTGFATDLRPHYLRSTVCVVPLRAGGGTRLKILEAMAFGRAVVSTSVGCEGLDVVDGEHLLVADRAEDFASKTLALLTDETLRLSITIRARDTVERSYDWDALAERLMHTYSAVAGSDDPQV